MAGARLWTVWLWCHCFVTVAIAGGDLSWSDDSDLTSFISRPDIKAPRITITANTSETTRPAPGHWFLSPYANVNQEYQASKYYQACQTGPAIYDNEGELVWSGACKFRNQNAHDFRAWQFNGSTYLSAIMYAYRGIGDKVGHGVLLDDAYNVVQNISTTKQSSIWNMHELHLSDEGRTVRFMTWRAQLEDVSSMKLAGVTSGWVGDIGFIEVDLVQNKNMFEFWSLASGEIGLPESQFPVKDIAGPWPRAWDFIHANSIDKNDEGDYIMSGRYTDTIYKISGKTGKVIWRLGGWNSSFVLDDFTFSRQHDARTLSINSTTEVISFFDNASDEMSQISHSSSAMVVALDRRTMHAKALLTIPRPDNKLTRLRGNHQTLSNGHKFICWSENGYVSEHTPSGSLIFQAKFASHRFVTYRGYKFEHVGRPGLIELAVVGKAHGAKPEDCMTAVSVSWNGATEVQKWRFSGKRRDGAMRVVGEMAKSGFETTFYMHEYLSAVLVEGLDKDGKVLGQSKLTTVSTPTEWKIEVPALPGAGSGEGSIVVDAPFEQVSWTFDANEMLRPATGWAAEPSWWHAGGFLTALFCLFLSRRYIFGRIQSLLSSWRSKRKAYHQI